MNQISQSPEEARAIRLEESGEYAGAVEIWLKLAKMSPTAVFFSRAGGALNAMGRHEDAENAFRSAIKIDPGMSIAYLGLSSSLIDQGKLVEAVKILDDSVTRKEDGALAFELRGIALAKLGRSEEALASYRQAILSDPEYDEAYYNIGCLLRIADVSAAETAFRSAIAIDPSYSAAHRELGWISRKANRLELAEQHLHLAIHLNAKDCWSWIYLGNTLWAKGDFSGAKDAFLEARRLCPDEWYTNWTLAAFYQDAQQFELAARSFHRALLVSPNEVELLLDYGRFLAKAGDRHASRQYLERVLEADPENEKARSSLEALIRNRLDDNGA